MRRGRSLGRLWLTTCLAAHVACWLSLGFVLGVGWAPAYFVSINFVTLVLYATDKRAARRGDLRVPERVLHSAALAGGSPAALLGQRWLRHKTAKRAFQVTFWLIFAGQIVIVALWYWPR